MSLCGQNRPQRYPVCDQNCQPHSSDLNIDPAYILENFVGIDIYNNTELIDKKAKSIQFRGNLVNVSKDADGKVIVYIKQKSYSKVGTFDGLTDGNLYLSPALESRFKRKTTSVYDDESQTDEDFYKIIGNGTDTDIFSWETKDKVFFANNINTYLVISLLDFQGNPLFTVESARITGNTTNIIMGDNRNCTVQIFDFELTQTQEYCGKIKLRINLAAYFHISSKFSIKVTHYNSQFNECITTWTSPNYFYLVDQQFNYNTYLSGVIGSESDLSGVTITTALTALKNHTEITCNTAEINFNKLANEFNTENYDVPDIYTVIIPSGKVKDIDLTDQGIIISATQYTASHIIADYDTLYESNIYNYFGFTPTFTGADISEITFSGFNGNILDIYAFDADTNKYIKIDADISYKEITQNNITNIVAEFILLGEYNLASDEDASFTNIDKLVVRYTKKHTYNPNVFEINQLFQ